MKHKYYVCITKFNTKGGTSKEEVGPLSKEEAIAYFRKRFGYDFYSNSKDPYDAWHRIEKR